MKRFGAFAAALLLSCLSLQAAEPKPLIEGPSQAIAGDMVILDATKSAGVKHFRWRLLSPVISGRKMMEVAADNKSVRLATYPGTYVVQLLVGNDEGVDATTHQVIVTGDCVPQPEPPVPVPPGPGPTPVPVPVPEPSFPPGQFSISADAYKWAMAVTAEKRADEAHAMATSCESLAAQVAAGTVKGDQTILNAIGAAFDAGVGSDAAAWKQFRSQLAERVKTIYFDGNRKGPMDWAPLLREVSLGLKAVK